MKPYALSLALMLSLAACATTKNIEGGAPAASPSLPIAHSNNAVALAIVSGEPTLFSFNGLRAGKQHTDISKQAFACPLAQAVCQQISDVPVSEGRLASSAITLANTVYLFGGYSVAQDGSEISTPDVLAFDPETRTYTALADMPTPVDDAVLFTHSERYIYVISGWHNTDNVSQVQVYDTRGNTWSRATDYPGRPVFGHAGGAANGEIVIADGVAVLGTENGRRQYGEVNEAWHGIIDASNPLNITWSRLPPHPHGPLYRMAATGSAARGQIIFAGGGDNPYNITGVGYDGVNAVPSDRFFAYDLASDTWLTLGILSEPSMDHRGLLEHDGRFYIIGGLDSALNVRGAITVFTPED